MGEARLPARKRAALALLLVLALPGVAWAHASLVKSVPAQRAVLQRPPAHIQLWFNERLEPRYSSLTVVDSKGARVETGAMEIGADDPKRLSAALKELPAGRYTVKYRVLSTDGHIVQSEFPFTVRQ
jgi:copper resistance protein C